MDVRRCLECGDTKPLDSNGVCTWRAGCEHRQMVTEARMAELDRYFAPPVPATAGDPVAMTLPPEFDEIFDQVVFYGRDGSWMRYSGGEFDYGADLDDEP